MTVQEWVAVGGLSLAIVSAGVRALWIVFNRMTEMSKRQGQIEFMATETWNAIMRRAFADGIITGTITMTEHPHRAVPYVVNSDAKEWLTHLAPILRDAYNREWHDLDDNHLALAIEARFGERIMQEVCIPRRMTNLQCLLIACAVARGD